MIKSFFKEVNYYWFFLLFTAFLSYGFFICNSSMSIDDEFLNGFNNFTNMLMVNRPARLFFDKVFNNYAYIPFHFDFLTIIILITSISVYSDIFLKHLNKAAVTVFACAAISFPFLIYNFIFMEVTFMYSICTLLSALALMYFYKYIDEDNNKKYLFIAFIMLACILSIYETPVLFFIISVLFIEQIKMISQDNFEFKNYSKSLTLMSLTSISAYIFTSVFIKLLKIIYHMSYDRLNYFLKYDTSSFINFIHSLKTAIITFLNNFMLTCHTNFGSLLTVICYILFIAIMLYFAIKKRNIFIVINALFMMIVPFAIFLALGNAELPYRNYSALSFFNAFVLCVLYMIFEKRRTISRIILLIIGLCIISSAQEITRTTYTEYLKFQDDRLFASAVMYDLMKENLEHKPLIFIGTKENPRLKHTYYIEAAEINISVFNWDRYNNIYDELFTPRIYNFMREQGFDVKGYTEQRNLNISWADTIQEIKNEAKTMNIYPQKNSIKELDKFVLIKIGESRFDI